MATLISPTDGPTAMSTPAAPSSASRTGLALTGTPQRRRRGAPDAHALAHVRQRLGGDRPRALGAPGEDRLERPLVGAQLLVALAHRRQVVDHRGRHRHLEFAVAARPRTRASTASGVDAAHGGEDFDQVGDPRLLGRAADLAAGVGDRALELLLDRRRLVEHVHGALGEPPVVDILLVGILQVHDPRADLGDAVLGHDQHLLAVAEPRVEAPRDVAHQLEVLALVLADRHLVRAVGEHVGRLQHRVEQQPRGDQLALGDDLSRNWCMRCRRPSSVTLDSSQVSSVCSGTSLWRKRMQRAGSRPAASRSAVRSYSARAARPGRRRP